VSSFFEEFLLKRQANATNVYVVETHDPKRIAQFLRLVSESDLFTAHRKIVFDLQTGELIDAETGVPAVQQPTTLFGSAAVTPGQLLSLLRAQPVVLFVSYVYAERHAQHISDVLVAVAHDDAVYRNMSTAVVFTSDASLFPYAVRRFAHTLSPPPSTPEEREEVLRAVAARIRERFEERYGREIQLTIDADIISASSGLTLHDVETAALESFATKHDFCVEAFTQYKIKLLREAGLEYIQPSRGFESVGGYDYLKEYVARRVVRVLRNPELAVRYGLGVPKGILLYGPPGTGKTWFAKALAREVGLPMVIVDPSTFLRGIVGETEARVKQVTQIVESLAPVIVFIDEFDQLTLSRQAVMSTDSGVSRRMTNMLLSWLGDEDRKSFVVGATNFISDVDPTFLRPGRLDEVIPVFYPDVRAREEILRIHTSVVRKIPLADDVNLCAIAERTHLWTGAELEKLVLEAASLAMEEGAERVTQAHFERALRAFEVNVAERGSTFKRMVNELMKLENVNRTLLARARAYAGERALDARVMGVVG
jgi:ATP-dependent 26S proteasome regulatory subunit